METCRPFAPFLPFSPTEAVHNLLDITETERDRYFQKNIAPHLARRFVNKLRLYHKEPGDNGKELEISSVDFTLAGT